MTSNAIPADGATRPVIAFAGLGAMGDPMVRQLAAAGHRLRLFDIRPGIAEALAAETGGKAAGSGDEAGEGADIVITMLPDHEAVARAVLGEGDAGGLAAGMASGGVVIDMSSSYPLATRALGAALAARGIGLLDAPVSGGVRRARDGTLAIMLGGDDAAALDRAEPVLSAMGRVFRTGPLGSGHAIKALNNFVSAAGLAAAAEALVVATRFGLDPKVTIDVINASTGRNNATENKFHQFILNRDFGSGFALDLMAKDITIAQRLADDLDCAVPTLTEMRMLWRSAAEALGPGADHTEIARYLESYAGRTGED